MPRLSKCIMAALLSACFVGSDANAYRGGFLRSQLGKMRAEELRSVLLEELVAALGGSRVAEQRLGKIEAALKPMFLALPKNEHGNLEHSAVRYALHRLFVQRHGMYIKGLEPGGEAWNTSSAAEVLEDRVPAYVQSLFEERLHGRGLGAHEIAALAATLEHLIHSEAVDRLQSSYQIHEFPLDGRLSEAQVDEVVDTYMVMYILGKNTSATPEDILEERASIQSVYPRWPESQQFAREVRRSVVRQRASEPDFAADSMSFEGAEAVVEEIGERYGRWQNSECKDLKATLMKMEVPDTGRVLLRDFYSTALGGNWQFTESVDYLRDLGALDESNPKQMSVIIPNYVNSPSNCLASSSLYSVCCVNECEALLGEVERQVGAPDAEPARLLDVVSGLSSATVVAPRVLSSALIERLDEVASHHGGLVPLHGRLFAQFLHHAFPRECPYPHKAGTTNPMTADEWMQERGFESLTVSDEELMKHAQAAPQAPVEDSAEDVEVTKPSEHTKLIWTAEEELVARAAPQPARRPAFAFARSLAMLAAAGATAVLLLNAARGALAALASAPAKPRGRAQQDDLLPFSLKSHTC